ncbi:CBS domain-containing protein [Streptomyces sp. NBC_01497]|uniref:CBS domain-containing protein n=1 Tax=Streptomyces sp. NBC_01497 TaxID=2903885 RepID=UPI002E316CE9|nr:CBS domain-containing protein [Streptomyces sp. NBC_01497]
MTLVRMGPRSASAVPAYTTVADAMDTAGPRVPHDMAVGAALAVMAGTRAGHLLVRDADGLCTGLVTRAQLNAVADGSASTDRGRLCDILSGHGPFTSPVTTVAEAEHTMRHRRLAALPVVDEQGSALGIPALAR